MQICLSLRLSPVGEPTRRRPRARGRREPVTAVDALATKHLRRRTAIHEAGHAVAAFALGGPRVVKVSILNEGTSLGRVSLAIPAARWEELRSQADGSATREQVECLVTVLLAGIAAERNARLRGSWRYAEDDLLRAYRHLSRLAGSEEEASAYLGWLLERARNVVALHARAVRALAHALLRDGELSGAEAKRIAEPGMFENENVETRHHAEPACARNAT